MNISFILAFEYIFKNVFYAFILFPVLGEFPPVEPTDYKAKAFRGIRVDCNTPSYYPGRIDNV